MTFAIVLAALVAVPSSSLGSSPVPFGIQTSPSPHIPGWTNLTGYWPSDDRAPPRAHASVTPEPPLNSDVRFGGVDPSGVLTNDSWIYIASEGDWKSLTRLMGPGAPAPPPLRDAAMSFDPVRGNLVLFGGQLSNGTPYGGTWLLRGPDWRNYTWSHYGADVGPTPPPTTRPLLAWDPSVGAIVLVDPARGGSTWVFRGGWANLSTLPPATLEGSAALSYDVVDGALVLVGVPPGSGPPSPSPPPFSELFSTWRFSGGTWSSWPGSVAPPWGEMGGLVWDDARSAAILVTTAPTHQVWSFAAGHWQNLSDGQGPPPPIVSGAALVYDAWGQFVLLWGGVGSTGTVTGDMWGWDAPPLGQLRNSPPAAAPFPPFLLAVAGGLGGVPLAIAAYLYLRPRRPKPTVADRPVPSPAAG